MKNLWHELNIGNENLLNAEGILYASRMSQERITGHRDQIVEAITGLGLTISEHEEGLAIGGYEDSNHHKIEALFEELSVLNRGAEYKSVGLDSIARLPSDFNMAWYRMSFQRNLADAYNMMDIEARHLGLTLQAIDKKSRVLYAHERTALDELLQLADNKVNLMNGRGGYVIIGARDI